MKKLKNKQKLERLHEKERKEKAKIIEFQSEKKKEPEIPKDVLLRWKL